MIVSVLYISYTGILEPLGQSQVLQYMKGLAKNYHVKLLTFEKGEALDDRERVALLMNECQEAGVEWHRLRYHNKPNMLATFYDSLIGIKVGLKIAREDGVHIVHCRSYVAGIMGLVIKWRTGTRHVFDMRGFWPDERVDGGIWRKSSFRYRLFKRLERSLFLNTDHVVSLTRAGEKEIRNLDYLMSQLPPISVIPTCTNLSLFRPGAISGERHAQFTLGYVGSTGSWYLFDKVSRLVKILFDTYPNSKFLVISKGDRSDIFDKLLVEGVDLKRVEVKSVGFRDVAAEISRMDAGIYFIKQSWSKRASCPTRMGEFLAMGKPCISNTMVGDVAADLRETKTGIAVEAMNDGAFRKAIEQLMELSADLDTFSRCRQVAENRFSLEVGITKYSTVYTSLCE